MFRKTGATILGIVENMAYFSCEHPDEQIPRFASLPLDIRIGQGGTGQPLMQSAPESDSGKLFSTIARKVVEACG